MNNPIISLDLDFIKAVRAYSFISKSEGSISDEDITIIATNDVYPRILTRIALTTDKNGIPIFGGIGNSKDYGMQYLKSMEVMNMLPYSLGLKRVGIALTASAIIRFIPLKSDITLLEAAESIEKGALDDLDKLIGILANDTNTVTSLQKLDSTQNTSYKALFISQDIDERTIPIEAFTHIVDTIALYKGAKVYPSIIIPEGYIGICIVTLSCQVKQAVLKEAFIVDNGSTTTDIVTIISQVINELNIELGTGIIASPNKGAPELVKIPISSIRLYPDSSIDKNLQLYIELTPGIDVIEIVSQVLSPVRDKEVLMVDFYSVPIPKSSNLSISSQDLINMVKPYYRGIRGLVFGTIGKYSELTNKGPHSAVIEIDKGTLITKQEQVILNPGESAIDLKQDIILDTFHFRLAKNHNYIESSIITIRVNTQPVTLETNIWTLAFSGGSLDDLLSQLLDNIFINSRPSCLVAAITSPYALQIVPHLLTDDETRIVIDLINLPLGVEVSTGTDRLFITPFKNGTRSVNVPAIRISSSELSKRIDNVLKTSPNQLTSSNKSSINYDSVSDKLMGVRERLKGFEQCSNLNNNKSSSCTSNSYWFNNRYYTLNDVIDIYLKDGHI
jgi:hypothetical protein